jgi:hypothetical protein
MLAHLTPANEYNWIWIIIGVGMICAGAFAFLRWMMTQVLHEVKPNGGTTLSLGDTTARTEAKVDILIAEFREQKGHTDTVETEVYRRMATLETRTEVEVRRLKES